MIVMLGIGRSESGAGGSSSLGVGGWMREGGGVGFCCDLGLCGNTSTDASSCFGAIGRGSVNRGGGFLFVEGGSRIIGGGEVLAGGGLRGNLTNGGRSSPSSSSSSIGMTPGWGLGARFLGEGMDKCTFEDTEASLSGV